MDKIIIMKNKHDNNIYAFPSIITNLYALARNNNINTILIKLVAFINSTLIIFNFHN